MFLIFHGENMNIIYRTTLLMLIATSCLYAQPKDGRDLLLSGEKTNWSLISNCGLSVSDSGYTMEATLGQPITGVSSGQQYLADHGFWYTGMEKQLDVADEQHDDDFINVIPSMASNGTFTVRTSLTGSVMLEIYNSIGVRAYSMTFENREELTPAITVGPLSLPAGAYYITAGNGKRRLTAAFIIIN